MAEHATRSPQAHCAPSAPHATSTAAQRLNARPSVQRATAWAARLNGKPEAGKGTGRPNALQSGIERLPDKAGARATRDPASAQPKPAPLPKTAAQAPVQLARIPVGYDRVATAAQGDTLVTDGLGNCIAIAALDANTGRAVMGHFNTLNAWNNVAMLTGFRRLLLNELQRVAGAPPNATYRVSLGGIWLNLAPIEAEEDKPEDSPEVRLDKARRRAARRAMDQRRHTLMVNIRAVFGVEPTTGGRVAEFDPATGQMTGSAELGVEAGLVAPPQNDPHGTAGDEITEDTYARLQSGNVRGHKLDKNMTVMDKLSVLANPN